MRFLLKCVAGTLSVLLVLVLLSPWLVYEVTLHGIEGRPARPTHVATAEQQAAVWKKARGTGEPRVEAQNPYTALVELFSEDPQTRRPIESPSHTMTVWVAREYVLSQRQRGNLSANIAIVALTIWLTRHWSTDEIATAAFDITKDWPERPRRPRDEPQP